MPKQIFYTPILILWQLGRTILTCTANGIELPKIWNVPQLGAWGSVASLLAWWSVTCAAWYHTAWWSVGCAGLLTDDLARGADRPPLLVPHKISVNMIIPQYVVIGYCGTD